MQDQVSTISAQEQALSGLETQFTSLQDALQSIGSATQGSLTAQSSQPLAASANVTSGALAGTYQIAIDNVGSSTSTLSKAGLTTVTDPNSSDITSSTNLTLTVNNTPHSITMTGTSLISLANSINAASLGVTATVINVGSNSSPDYRLAVTSNNLGGDTIQLNDGSHDLLDNVVTGTPATYEVNGSTTQLQSNSRQVTLAPGLTVDLLNPTTSGTPATITVASDYSGLQSALSSFATAYNSAVDAVNQQVGSNAGPLAGQSTVYTLANVLHSVAGYSGATGSVGSLTDLGLDLDQTGHLTFNSGTFANVDTAAVQQFLGSISNGGFLQSASQAISSLSDPTNGVIQTNVNVLGNEITGLNDQITQEQTRINDLTTNLQAQLSAADAAIATLQSQKTYYTNLFDATYLQGLSGLNG